MQICVEFMWTHVFDEKTAAFDCRSGRRSIEEVELEIDPHTVSGVGGAVPNDEKLKSCHIHSIAHLVNHRRMRPAWNCDG